MDAYTEKTNNQQQIVRKTEHKMKYPTPNKKAPVQQHGGQFEFIQSTKRSERALPALYQLMQYVTRGNNTNQLTIVGNKQTMNMFINN